MNRKGERGTRRQFFVTHLSAGDLDDFGQAAFSFLGPHFQIGKTMILMIKAPTCNED